MAKAIRLGTLALMRPGDHVDARPLGGQHEVDAHGAGLLGDLDDGVLDLAALAHDQVGQLVDDEHDVRQPLLLGHARAGVVGGDVALALAASSL